MQNLKECGHERRGVMTERNRSSFAVVTFYTTRALVTALGLTILITSATIARPFHFNGRAKRQCVQKAETDPKNYEIAVYSPAEKKETHRRNWGPNEHTCN